MRSMESEEQKKGKRRDDDRTTTWRSIVLVTIVCVAAVSYCIENYAGSSTGSIVVVERNQTHETVIEIRILKLRERTEWRALKNDAKLSLSENLPFLLRVRNVKTEAVVNGPAGEWTSRTLSEKYLEWGDEEIAAKILQSPNAKFNDNPEGFTVLTEYKDKTKPLPTLRFQEMDPNMEWIFPDRDSFRAFNKRHRVDASLASTFVDFIDDTDSTSSLHLDTSSVPEWFRASVLEWKWAHYLHSSFRPCIEKNSIARARSCAAGRRLLEIFLPQTLAGNTDIPVMRQSLFVSNANVTTMLHYDIVPGMIWQVKGRKRILLSAPEVGGRLLDPYPPVSPFFRQSKLGHREDLSAMSPSKLETLGLIDVTVMPGVGLFVPQFWWHNVISLDTPTWSHISRQIIIPQAHQNAFFMGNWERYQKDGLFEPWKSEIRNGTGDK